MRRRSLAGVIATLLMAALVTVVAHVSGSAAAATGYTWKNVRIDGGGFVPGIIFNPTEKNLIYARTDIGGAYRWDQSSKTWTPLLDWVGQSDWGHNGVVSLATDPVNTSKVYAAVGMYTNSWDPNNGAILRSSDKGATWQTTNLPFKLGGNMPGRGMGERLAIDPNNDNVLYFGAPSGNGLWRSTDAGVTWSKVTSFTDVGTYIQQAGDAYLGDNQGVTWVTFDKSSSSSGSTTKTIYVGVADKDNTVWRSTDGGSTWSRLAGQPTGYLAHKGVLDSANGYLYIATSDTGGPYDGAKGAVWRYKTSTGAWTDISPVATSSSDDYFGYSGLTIDRQHPGTIMVATQISWWPDMIMWRSTDSGATWTRIWDWTSYPSRSFRYTQDISSVPWLTFGSSPTAPEVTPKLGWMNESVEIDPFNSDRLMYGTGATIYGTENLTTWDSGGQIKITPMVKGLEETAVEDLVSPPSGAPLLSALGDVGGFRHTDLTAVPSLMYTTPNLTTTTSIDFAELNPNYVVRVGNIDKSSYPNVNRIGISNDNGASWYQGQEPSGVTGGGTVAVAADGSTIVWAPQGAAVSYGGGSSWTSSTGVPSGAIVKSDRVNPKKFYAYANGTFYASTDAGHTFTATAAAGLPTSGVHFKAVPGIEGDIWLSGSTGLYHSTNSGASFTQISGITQAWNIGLGKAAPGQSYMALYTYATINGVTGIFRSDDKAGTWTRINDDQHQYGNAADALTGDPRVYGRIYLGTNGRGIIYGDTSGTTTTSPTPTPTSPTPTPTSPTPTPTSPTPTAPAGGCTATYSVTNTWSGGFQGAVTVTAGSSAISGWKVAWTYANGQTISQYWSANVTQSGTSVTATNASYNGSLSAGASTQFGFLATQPTTNPTPAVTCTAT